jgi:hypothetical protein
MTDEEQQLLVEQVAGAYRPPTRAHEDLRYHPAWHDLDAACRQQAFERGRALRALESALDAEGLSTTAHAVLARIGMLGG